MKIAPFASAVAGVAVLGLVAWAKPGVSSSDAPVRSDVVAEDTPAAPTMPLPSPTPSAAPSTPAPWAAILPALQRMQPGAPQPAAPQPTTPQPSPAAPQPAPSQPAAPQPAAPTPGAAPAQPFPLPAGLPPLPLPSALPKIPSLPAIFPTAQPPAQPAPSK